MSPNDKEALARLEEEKERRILEKVAAGQAVFIPPIVVGVEPDVPAMEGHRDASGRELYYGTVKRDGTVDRTDTIITGVPRAGRDAEEAIQRLVERAKQTGYPSDPLQAKAVKAREAPQAPPPPEPEPEPERHYVHVEIRPASENDPGQIIEGRYAVIGSLVQVWDLNGRLLGSGAVKPDEDPKSVARKILRVKSDCGNSFYRPLYPRGSIH